MEHRWFLTQPMNVFLCIMDESKRVIHIWAWQIQSGAGSITTHLSALICVRRKSR